MIVIGSTNLSSSLEAVAPVGSVAWLIPPPKADASDQEKRKAASVTVPNVQVYCENTKNKDVVGIITQSAPRRKDKSIVEATNLGVCVSGIATTQMDDSGNFVPGTRLEVHLPPNQYLDIEQHRNSKWSSLRLKRGSRRKNNGGRLCFRSLGIRKRQQGQVMVALCSMPRGPQDIEFELLEQIEQPPEINTSGFKFYQQQLIKYLRGLKAWPSDFDSDYIDTIYKNMESRGKLPFYEEWEPKKSFPLSGRKMRKFGYSEPSSSDNPMENIRRDIQSGAQTTVMAQSMAATGNKRRTAKEKKDWFGRLFPYILSIFGRGSVKSQDTDPSDLGLFILAELVDRTEEEDLQLKLGLVFYSALPESWVNQTSPRTPMLYTIEISNDLDFDLLNLYCSYCVRFLYNWYTSNQDDIDSEIYTVDQITYCINMLLKGILILLRVYAPKSVPSDFFGGTVNSNSSESSSEGSGTKSGSYEGPQVDSDDRSSVASSDVSNSDSDSAPGLEG